MDGPTAFSRDVRTPYFAQSSWKHISGVRLDAVCRKKHVRGLENRVCRSIACLNGSARSMVYEHSNIENEECAGKRKYARNVNSRQQDLRPLFSPSLTKYSVAFSDNSDLQAICKRRHFFKRARRGPSERDAPDTTPKLDAAVTFFNRRIGLRVSLESKLRWSFLLNNLSQRTAEQAADACLMNQMLLPQILCLFSYDPTIFFYSGQRHSHGPSSFSSAIASMLHNMAPLASTDLHLLDTVSSRLRCLITKLLAHQYVDPHSIFNELVLPVSNCYSPDNDVYVKLVIIMCECICNTTAGQRMLEHTACRTQMRQIANEYFAMKADTGLVGGVSSSSP